MEGTDGNDQSNQPMAALGLSGGDRRQALRDPQLVHNLPGPLLICSARRKDLSSLRLLRGPEFQLGLEPIAVEVGHGLVRPRDLPFGEAIALVNLVDCIPTGEVLARPELDETDEIHFGDFSPGRFAWKLEDLVAIPRGVPITGHLFGLWNQEMDEVLDTLEDQAEGIYDTLKRYRIAQHFQRMCPGPGVRNKDADQDPHRMDRIYQQPDSPGGRRLGLHQDQPKLRQLLRRAAE